MAGATAGGRAGTAAAIKRRRKKEALNQVWADTDLGLCNRWAIWLEAPITFIILDFAWRKSG